MAESPDLRGDAALAFEGIAGRGGAVIIEPHDLAEVRLQVLRGIEFLALARGDVEESIGPEHQAMTEVAGTVHLRLLAPDDLQILKLATAVRIERERRARRRRRRACRASLGSA